MCSVFAMDISGLQMTTPRSSIVVTAMVAADVMTYAAGAQVSVYTLDRLLTLLRHPAARGVASLT